MSHVVVLKGGRSLERQVSLKSGARVEDALRRLGHQVEGIDVGPDLVRRLIDTRPDAVFVALHGRDGEDGTVQELLEVLGIPYTGSRAAACAMAADKVSAKRAFIRAGIPTADFFSFSEGAFGSLGAGQALGLLDTRLGFPIVVKPAGQGSALGIRIARTAAELPAALIAAFSYDRNVLLERFIDGRDLAVGIIDGAGSGDAVASGDAMASGDAVASGDGGPGRGSGQPMALPVVEALPEPSGSVSGAAYDYESRYEIGRTRFECPADLPEAVSTRAQQLGLAAYRQLGASGFARADLMLDAVTGELSVLELNPIPGLTETSLLPLAADAAGIGFDALIGQILAGPLTRA